MPGDETGTLQQRRRDYRTGDDWGATIGIIIVATIVFFFVNGQGSNASDRQSLTAESTFNNTAFLGGVDRQNSSTAFRGGEATAFMGGIKLDLRDAIMEGNEARIDVTTIMGGVKLRIPRTWTVINRVTPIMGGVADHSHSTESNKRLIVEGTVFMGGLNINN